MMPFRKPGWDLADWLQQHREPGCLADDRDRDLPKHAAVPRAAAGGSSRGGLPDPIIGREGGGDPEQPCMTSASSTATANVGPGDGIFEPSPGRRYGRVAII